VFEDSIIAHALTAFSPGCKVMLSEILPALLQLRRHEYPARDAKEDQYRIIGSARFTLFGKIGRTTFTQPIRSRNQGSGA
jgi:hypothetical protein